MSNKRQRKKLNRAAPQLSGMPPKYAPGGATMYVPPSYTQSILGQTYYGTQLKNEPSSWTSLFSPGVPLAPQPTVNPEGKLVQFRFPIGYNTFPVDRTLGNQDIPSFQVLRNLAKMYDGIGLCERFWLDMVPRMTLNIRLKKMYVDAGAEEKNYQKEITFFRNFFDKPDGKVDTHSWLSKALREQTQIDELYLYKNKTRGGKLLGLQIVDGSQMKPLLDDWGMLPDPPKFAYQQYPWGIPGWQYRADQIIHYQETPAAETPYGTSRVERIILRVNQALRKEKKDLSYFTEGNIPQSFMEVPESLNWTPDQIDSYEQSWNALLAGNAQQQVRIKFMQPGMKYTPADQYQLMTDFDMFLFKTTFGMYGVPPSEFGFVEGSALSSSGESQEDIVYRRTIEPLALVYGHILTHSMNEDFPPDMHGEMFEACFGGYEEVDDENEKAQANTTYTGAGVLGLTEAAKLAQLPIDPTSKPIGRILTTPNGPLFLDDEEFMTAWRQAQIVSFRGASNPPTQPQEQGEDNEDSQQQQKKTPQKAAGKGTQATPNKAKGKQPTGTTPDDESEDIEDEQMPPKNPKAPSRLFGDSQRRDSEDAREAAQFDYSQTTETGLDRAKAISAEYRRWRERAITDAKVHRTQRPFVSTIIPDEEYMAIWDALRTSLVPSVDDVRTIFDQAREREASPKEPAVSSGGLPVQNRSTWKLRW